MSTKHQQTITCLNCKKSSNFDFYESVNTTLDPVLKQRVKNLDLFRFTCPHCGSEQFVAYSFLYHDMNNKLMIYCCQDQEEVDKVRELYARDFTTAAAMPGEERAIDTTGYRRRIVIGIDALLEKIRIFDADLDDRIIEIYKILLYGQMQPQLAAMPGGDNIDGLFLDEGFDKSLSLVFLADGQAKASVPFAQDVYDIIAKEYNDAVNRLAKDEPVIDQDWAFDLLATVAKEQR